mgnify:CR=1 FL=1
MTNRDDGRLRELLAAIGGQRVLVVGDLYLDRYIFGQPSRISREAPIMVLNEDRQEDRLGGGAAPALALTELGCDVAVAGVVGDDSEGTCVVELLHRSGIDTVGVVVDASRPTTAKIRVVAEGFFLFPQQIVRVDRQERAPAPDAVERRLCDVIQQANADAVLVSDYRSGVVTEQVVTAIRDSVSDKPRLKTVDSQGELTKFSGFDLVKCNQGEAEQVLGHPLGDRSHREESLPVLRRQIGCGALVVTRGGDGASIVTDDGYAEISSSNRSEVYDVTGAGDTVVAVMTAAMLAGGSAVEAAMLAQVAAGVVVRKWGNAQATRDEIASALS